MKSQSILAMALKVPTRDISLDCIVALSEVKKRMEAFQHSFNTDRAYLRVNDSTPNSDYYFQIVDVKQGVNASDKTAVYIYTEFKPGSTYSSEDTKVETQIKDFDIYFNSWVNRVEQYTICFNQLVPDTIVKGYEEEYYTDFDIIDEDADVHSYTNQTQNNIDDFLGKVSERLKRYRAEPNISHEIAEEIDILLADIENLRKTQGRQTKRTVFRRMINIVARCRKAAPSLAREFGYDMLKDLLLENVKDPSKFLDTFKGFLES